jgi:hypothetical protein
MTRGKHGNHVRGPNSPRWNKEKMIASNGYVKLRVGKDHPLADPNGYAYEHLVIWISAGNPMPKRDEVIHHKNEQKADNRLQNLELKKRVDHSISHHNGLTDESVRLIRELYAQGDTDMLSLGLRFQIPAARISKIIRGEVRLRAGGPISTKNRGMRYGSGSGREKGDRNRRHRHIRAEEVSLPYLQETAAGSSDPRSLALLLRDLPAVVRSEPGKGD